MPRVLRGVAAHLQAAERPVAAVSVDAEPAHVLRSLDGAHRTANLEVTEPGSHPHSGISTRANTPLPAVNSFGVSTVLPGYGILPKKVRTAAEALECVNRDGAVILTGLGTSDPTGAESFKVTLLSPFITLIFSLISVVTFLACIFRFSALFSHFSRISLTFLASLLSLQDTALALPAQIFGDGLLVRP